MPQIIFRYDMRQPDFSDVARADMYAAAIDQCAWADRMGHVNVHLSEHHGSEDGYCPSPLVFASEQLIEEARGMVPNQPIMFHPLCGGVRPELAWQSLELFEARVLPTLKKENLLI